MREQHVIFAQTKNWHHKAKDSYILSLGEMKKVKMNVKFCANCNALFYPELYQFGMVPVHNKANISFHPIYHINKKINFYLASSDQHGIM